METLTLQYWFCHEDVDNVFEVEISATRTVAGLQKVIKNENSEFRDVDAKNLNLYSIPLPDDESIEEELRQWTSSGKQRLPPQHKLSKYFPPAQRQWLIVVDAPYPVELTCWFHDEEPDALFSVRALSNDTLQELQEAIKAKRLDIFHDVPAARIRLNLYSIPLPDDESIEEELRQWTFSGKQRLPSRHKLSKCFPPHQTQQLIVVDSPYPVKFTCWFHHEDPDVLFSVRVLSNDTLQELQKAIKAERLDIFRDVPAARIRLHQVPNLTVDQLEDAAKEIDHENLLLASSKLSDIFSANPLDGRVHVIVSVRASAGQTTSGQAGEERGVIAALAEKFKLSMSVSSPAPSTVAKPDNYARFQAGNGHLLDCRFSAKSPTETIAPPIQLFNPAFAFFSSKAFDPTYAVDDDNVCAARELMAEFAAIHDSETTRQLKIEPFISKAIGRDLKHTRNLDNTSPDYVVKSLDTSFPAYLVIVEEKNEFGEGGSDPSVQASFSYRNLLLQPESAKPRLRSGCPAFIIAHAGPWLSIMGGISLGRYVVQRLTDYVWVPQHSTHDDKQCLRIARIFCALKQSIAILDLWYKNLDPEAALYDPNDDTAPLHRRFWPSPITYRERGTNALVEFTYERPLEDRDTCVTYLAKTRQGDPKDIVVKFVTSYGVEAHEHMASKGFAPRLLSYGEISVPLDIPGVPSYSYGDLRMVVMEYVNGETLHNALKKRRIPPSFKSDLTEAFQHLHDQGYVYGDLRPPNIMVLPTGTSPSTAQLIDFDWAGKEGEVKYPSTINSNTIAWPQGVKGMACIERKHDEVMLTALMYTRLGGL